MLYPSELIYGPGELMPTGYMYANGKNGKHGIVPGYNYNYGVTAGAPANTMQGYAQMYNGQPSIGAYHHMHHHHEEPEQHGPHYYNNGNGAQYQSNQEQAHSALAYAQAQMPVQGQEQVYAQNPHLAHASSQEQAYVYGQSPKYPPGQGSVYAQGPGQAYAQGQDQAYSQGQEQIYGQQLNLANGALQNAPSLAQDQPQQPQQESVKYDQEVSLGGNSGHPQGPEAYANFNKEIHQEQESRYRAPSIYSNNYGQNVPTQDSNVAQANTFNARPYGPAPDTIDPHKVLDNFLISNGLSPDGHHDSIKSGGKYNDGLKNVLSVKKLVSIPFYLSTSGDKQQNGPEYASR